MLKIAIIGGGVIGLSIGWQLARSHYQVQIFDRGDPEKQASLVGAGMLAPYSEALFQQRALLEQGIESLSCYPKFLEELCEDSQDEIFLEGDGTLIVAIDKNDREWLSHHYHHHTWAEGNGEWLSREAALAREPLLSSDICAGVWIPKERQINNRLLLPALKKAFLSRGGEFLAPIEVKDLVSRSSGVKGVITDQALFYAADRVIIAAGAWANQLGNAGISPEAGLHPIKGEIMTLTMPPELRLQSMIRSPRVYLAPKQDNIVSIGASSEDQGFDDRITAGGVLSLLEPAIEIIPAISEYPLHKIAVGFRPTTATHQLLLGAASVHGVYHALGHGRSGFLLAPYTAYSLKSMLMSEEVEDAISI